MAANQADIDIAPLIDYGLIDPTATPEQVEHCCQQAERFGFVTVCVYPAYVRQAVELLHGKKSQSLYSYRFSHRCFDFNGERLRSSRSGR